MKHTPIEFDDLASYSEWPKRLLSKEQPAIRSKTESEVIREYENEKWANLLANVRNKETITLTEVEEMYCPLDTGLVCFEKKRFWKASQGYMLKQHIELYAKELEIYLEGASALVELGAGYGSKIFALAEREKFQKIPLVAAEMTQNGQEIMKLLGNAVQRPIKVGRCDFRSLKVDSGLIPKNSIIFTSYAVHYVPELDRAFAEFLLSLEPKAVVHFEPIYECMPAETIHGLMCRRYVQINDYTTNLLSVTLAEAKGDTIKIQKIDSHVIGSNAFLPISILAWTPNYKF